MFLTCADAGDEPRDLGRKSVCPGRYVARDTQQVAGGDVGFLGSLGDARDVRRNRLVGQCRSLHAAGDFRGCGALLLDCRGDIVGNDAGFLDALGDAAYRGYRVASRDLNVGDLLADLLGCLGGLGREVLYLTSDVT